MKIFLYVNHDPPSIFTQFTRLNSVGEKIFKHRYLTKLNIEHIKMILDLATPYGMGISQ